MFLQQTTGKNICWPAAGNSYLSVLKRNMFREQLTHFPQILVHKTVEKF